MPRHTSDVDGCPLPIVGEAVLVQHVGDRSRIRGQTFRAAAEARRPANELEHALGTSGADAAGITL